jgi:hypothetical protein
METTMYKKFKVGQRVELLEDAEHQYYNYPVGYNLKIAKAGAVGIIRSIPPKVYGRGNFFNIVIDGECYPVMDYFKIRPA